MLVNLTILITGTIGALAAACRASRCTTFKSPCCQLERVLSKAATRDGPGNPFTTTPDPGTPSTVPTPNRTLFSPLPTESLKPGFSQNSAGRWIARSRQIEDNKLSA